MATGMITITIMSITTDTAMAALTKIWRFYYEGFASLTLGKTLWKLVLLKLLIMFGVFKLFFFSDTLHTTYDTEAEKSAHVIENLTKEIP